MVQLLGVLRGLFACIVVCFDGHLPADVVRGLLSVADRTAFLTDQSILRSRHSKYLLRALRLDECPLEGVGLVIDQYRKRVGLEPQNLAELLEADDGAAVFVVDRITWDGQVPVTAVRLSYAPGYRMNTRV